MASSVQPSYTSRLGLVTISTPNPNLDGTGPLSTVITGGSNGTLIKSLIIKAQSDTSEGMVRFFVQKSGGPNTLINEAYIPPIIKSGRDLSFYNVISINYTLENGEILKVSTENANTFNIIAECFDINYITATSFLGTSLQFIAAAGSNTINTANSNLNGTGAMSLILTSGAAASGFLGCSINSIVIKAQQTTSPGIVRLFLKGTGTPILFYEVMIPSTVQTATVQSFMINVISQGALCIPPDFTIYASTEKGEIFGVIVEGANWKYV